jgi:ABC-type Fe3+ transport system permease subunit
MSMIRICSRHGQCARCSPAWLSFCLLLALPVLGVLGAWLALDRRLGDPGAPGRTVLPGYVVQTALLALGVGLGVMVLGSAVCGGW